MIVRSPRPRTNFTIIHNGLVRDHRLSWKARGLLVYLLSQPDHWRTTIAHLASISPEGIHAVRTGLKELETLGYLERIRKQNGLGQWSTETIVYDYPGELRPVDDHVDNQPSYPQTEV
jgi:hypothetical protein